MSAGARLLDRIAEGRTLVLPGWHRARLGEDGEQWMNAMTGQTAIWSLATEADGRQWLHVSTAFPRRLPTWTELVAVKEWFAGTDTYAYQVCPPRAHYVNQHEFVLHLFVPLFDPPPLPEFAEDGHL